MNLRDDWNTRYQILETDSGLQISESRVMLLDVMEAHNEGDSVYQISQTFNLTPLQVQIALEYIEKHRTALEPQLARAIQLRQKREVYYQDLAAGRWEKIAQLPMTPLRAAFYALREKNRQVAGETNAVHSERS